MKNIDHLFNKYGLNKLSHGCSTGSEWFSSGETIQSFSPAFVINAIPAESYPRYSSFRKPSKTGVSASSLPVYPTMPHILKAPSLT